MKTKTADILEPYKLLKKKIKDYGTFSLYQMYGTRGGEEKALYKVCEWKLEAST